MYLLYWTRVVKGQIHFFSSFCDLAIWVRLAKFPFFVHGLSDTSIVMGGGTSSPRRIRCNRSNWLMARYI